MRSLLELVIIPASSVLEFLHVNCVSYKKARSQEPELETCWLISASQVDDVASDNACSLYEKYT